MVFVRIEEETLTEGIRDERGQEEIISQSGLHVL